MSETRPSALQTLSSREGGRSSIQIKLSSTKGNRRGQSANKSAAAALPGFMKIKLMIVLTEIAKVREQISSGGGRQ